VGGCSPEVNASTSTSPCLTPSPPPSPARPEPSPPLPPRLPQPPQIPPSLDPSSFGCKDPAAATYEADAPHEQNVFCIPAVRGCTLPKALNYRRGANVNDGTCRFSQSRCAMSLLREAWVAQAGHETWPVAVNRSADGSGCAIGPAVDYDRCLSMVPPATKSVGVVLTFALPPGVIEATVEVGLSPHAGRDSSAEFELRLVTQVGDVVASDLVVRSRRGTQIPSALLRATLPEESRGTAGTVLQLVANSNEGDARNTFVVWADPLLYCDSSCDICGSLPAAAVVKDLEQKNRGSDSEAHADVDVDDHAEGPSNVRTSSSLLGLAAFVLLAVGILCALAYRRCGAGSGLRTSSDGLPSAARQPGRVVGDVNIMRKSRPQEGEQRTLMGPAEDEDDGEDDAEEVEHVVL